MLESVFPERSIVGSPCCVPPTRIHLTTGDLFDVRHYGFQVVALFVPAGSGLRGQASFDE